jgi:hypothetical protein
MMTAKQADQKPDIGRRRRRVAQLSLSVRAASECLDRHISLVAKAHARIPKARAAALAVSQFPESDGRTAEPLAPCAKRRSAEKHLLALSTYALDNV